MIMLLIVMLVQLMILIMLLLLLHRSATNLSSTSLDYASSSLFEPHVHTQIQLDQTNGHVDVHSELGIGISVVLDCGHLVSFLIFQSQMYFTLWKELQMLYVSYRCCTCSMTISCLLR